MRAMIGLSLLMFVTSARADEATDIIKKAIEAHGGEAVLKKATAGEMALKGTTMALGAEVAFTGTTVYQLPGKHRMELNLMVMGAKMTIVQIANGDKVVMKVNNMAQKIDDATKAQLIEASALQEIFTLVPLLDDKKYTLKKEADEKIGDAEVSAILVKTKAFKDLTVYFEKKTGLLVKTKRKTALPDGTTVEETSVHSDFKKTDGVMTATKLKIQHNGKDFMNLEVSSAKIMEKADEKNFAMDN